MWRCAEAERAKPRPARHRREARPPRRRSGQAAAPAARSPRGCRSDRREPARSSPNSGHGAPWRHRQHQTAYRTVKARPGRPDGRPARLFRLILSKNYQAAGLPGRQVDLLGLQQPGSGSALQSRGPIVPGPMLNPGTKKPGAVTRPGTLSEFLFPNYATRRFLSTGETLANIPQPSRLRDPPRPLARPLDNINELSTRRSPQPYIRTRFHDPRSGVCAPPRAS
jgi:hypothetical protein